jgi:hypothetical protein
MTIDPDVRRIAAGFGVDAELIQAVMQAEGNILKAVQYSIPSITTREQAIQVTCRSAAHALSDFVKADPERLKAFVAFWGARWAPVGVANDPQGLNANWVHNVTAGWKA